MAVIITDMNMPKSCYDCCFGNRTYRDNRRCIISNNVYSSLLTEDDTPKDCPLKSVDEMQKEIADYKIMENPIGYILHVIHKYTDKE